jgi:hypothetical protein
MAYHAAGLAPPRIVWHDGPVSLAAAWASEPCVGANVKDAVVTAPAQRAIRVLDTHRDGRVLPLLARFMNGRSHHVGRAMCAAVIEDGGAIRLSLLTWLHRLRSRLAGMGRPAAFAEGSYSQHGLCCLGFTASLLEKFEPRAAAGLLGLQLIAGNAGWFLPHTHTCWLSDRPAELSFDLWGRLHSPSGPALRYRDGWSVYAWKNTRVPRWVIDAPQRISLDWIDAQVEPQVRRAMIDIFTPERFVEAGGAERVATDARGTAWFRKWTYRSAAIDAWAAIERPTRSGVRSFQCAPAHMCRPEEALAWLSGSHIFAGKRQPQPEGIRDALSHRPRALDEPPP